MKMFPTDRYYINIENGNIVTFREMLEEAAELYDMDDYTNVLELWDYYELTDIPVEQGREQLREAVEYARERFDA
jgi:hypothetical protein